MPSDVITMLADSCDGDLRHAQMSLLMYAAGSQEALSTGSSAAATSKAAPVTKRGVKAVTALDANKYDRVLAEVQCNVVQCSAVQCGVFR